MTPFPRFLARLTFALFFPLIARAGPPPGYQLAFDDEFTAASLASIAPGTGWGPIQGKVRWTCHTPYDGDFGVAQFSGPQDAGDGQSPFSIANGALSITAWVDPTHGWRSGLLCSVDWAGNGFAVSQGYFEARMQLPAGAGTWPAFWLADASNLRGANGNQAEIDILEAYGDDPTAAYQTVHTWGPTGAAVAWAGPNLVRKNGLETGYRVYGCWVQPDYVHFYLDGQEVWKTPSFPEALHPLYVMVNLALNAASAPNPSRLKVDYVRAYAPQK